MNTTILPESDRCPKNRLVSSRGQALGTEQYESRKHEKYILRVQTHVSEQEGADEAENSFIFLCFLCALLF
jgi:hypothetical protein